MLVMETEGDVESKVEELNVVDGVVEGVSGEDEEAIDAALVAKDTDDEGGGEALGSDDIDDPPFRELSVVF